MGSQHLITKVYFPRLLVPLSAAVDAAGGLRASRSLCLSAMLLWYGVVPGPAVVWLPLFVLLAVAHGVRRRRSGSRRSTCEYRDVRYVMPFLDAVLAVRDAGRLSGIARARAVARAVRPQPDGRRGRRLPLGAARADRRPGGDADRARSCGRVVVLLGGLFYFRRMERHFADVDLTHDATSPFASRTWASGTASARCERLPDAARRARRGAAGAPLRRRAPASPTRPTLWALDDVSLRGRRAARSSASSAQRRRQEHAAQDPVADHRARRAAGRASAAASASLLEVGTGFHPELTGRENIYLNGAILGMRARRSRAQFDEIVAFAEVERFIDTPVKRYSSGMYVRLAFAVAAHLEPEILIVDEVLAVGDAAFQRKCLGKMGDVAQRRPDRAVRQPQHGGGAAALHPACWLERGRLRDRAASRRGRADPSGDVAREFTAERRTGRPQILEAELIDARGNRVAKPSSIPMPFGFRVRFVLPEPRSAMSVGIGVLAADGTVVFTSNTDDVAAAMPRESGEYEAEVMLPADTLMAGDYHLAVCLWDVGQIFDLQEPALSFGLEHGPSVLYHSGDRKGLVHVRCAWQVGTAEPVLVIS